MKLLVCAKCSKEAESEDASYCYNCGAGLRNFCSNEDCSLNDQDEPFELPSYHKFCDSCGEKSTFMANGYFD